MDSIKQRDETMKSFFSSLGQRQHLMSLSLASSAFLLLQANSCSQPTATKLFKALRDCSSSQILTADSILYFGPTNAPIGTIYQVEKSGFDPLYSGLKITGNPPRPEMVIPIAFGVCKYDGKSGFDFTASLNVSVSPLPASGDISNDFKTAKITKMTADQVGWEVLNKGEYKKALIASKDVYSQISSQDVVASVALLKVKDYSSSLQITNGDTAALHAKYKDGPIGQALKGDISAAVQLQWTSDNTLTISIADETTIGGVLRKIDKGHVASGSKRSEFFGPSVGTDGDIVVVRSVKIN